MWIGGYGFTTRHGGSSNFGFADQSARSAAAPTRDNVSPVDSTAVFATGSGNAASNAEHATNASPSCVSVLSLPVTIAFQRNSPSPASANAPQSGGATFDDTMPTSSGFVASGTGDRGIEDDGLERTRECPHLRRDGNLATKLPYSLAGHQAGDAINVDPKTTIGLKFHRDTPQGHDVLE